MNFIIRVLLVPEIGEFSQDEIVSRRLKFLLRAMRFTTGIALFSSERRRHFRWFFFETIHVIRREKNKEYNRWCEVCSIRSIQNQLRFLVALSSEGLFLYDAVIGMDDISIITQFEAIYK